MRPVVSFNQAVQSFGLRAVLKGVLWGAALALPLSVQAAPADESGGVGTASGEISTTTSATNSWRKARETKFAYKIRSGFDSFANDKEQTQFYGIAGVGDFQAQLMSELAFRAKGRAFVSSGYAQSRFGDFVGSNGLALHEAYLNLRAVDTSAMRAYVAVGAHDQGALDAKLLVDDEQPFPGVKETIVLGSSKNFKTKFWAQQTIPTSKSLSTKTVDAETTPSFMTETLDATWSVTENLDLRGFVTHYRFNNLPSAVAYESQIYGNQASGIGATPNTARFKYDFDGFLGGGEMTVSLTARTNWYLKGYIINNTKAPETYNTAQYVQSGFSIGLPNEIDFKPSFAMFFVEDDVTPGFYNNSKIGHNNRQGYAARTDLFFQKHRFKLIAEYVDADVINSNLYQTRQQALTLRFETFYELL